MFIALAVFTPLVISILLLFLKKDKQLSLLSILGCLISFISVLMLIPNKGMSFDINGVFALGLHFTTDGLRIVLSFLAVLMWLATTVFTDEYFSHYKNKKRYYVALMLTLFSTLGVFLSRDMFSCFIFFEIMSFASYVLVIHDEDEATRKAANTYLAVAVSGGLVTLMGLFLANHYYGTLDLVEIKGMIDTIGAKEYWIFGLCLVGFFAKAGFFPLHIWLPKAHPVAPAPASAILSGVLTKAGVFGLLIISANIFMSDVAFGKVILVIATITMTLGAVLALFSINLKRTLACSSLSQIGFIGVGVACLVMLGHHNALASAGTILHIFNHSVLKLVLFSIAGVVYMNLHKLNFNEIKGFGKGKKLLQVMYIICMLGIAGLPLFNGYISKTLIHESLVEYMAINTSIFGLLKTCEIFFIISGGFTLAYMFKIYVMLFVDNASDYVKEHAKDKYMNLASTLALGIPCLIMLAIGLLPNITALGISNFVATDLASTPIESVAFFSLVNLKGALYTLIVGAITYFLVIRPFTIKNGEYKNIIPAWLDLEDSVYVPVIKALSFIGALVSRVLSDIVEGIVYVVRNVFFNRANKTFTFKENKEFTVYDEDARYGKIFHEDIGKSLLLISIGLALGLLYALI